MIEREIKFLPNGRLEVTIPVCLKHDGRKTTLLIDEDCGKTLDKDNLSPLQKALIQGFQFQKHLESGKIESVSALARKEHMDRAFLFRALSLVNLAPDIINLILDGREPKTITLNKLRKGFPEDWDEQRAFFGIK